MENKEMTNKEKSKLILDLCFGLDQFEKYDFNESKRTGSKKEFYFKLKDILSPSPSTYITVKKWLRAIKESTPAQYGEGSSARLYNNLIMVLAALEINISDSKMEYWEGRYPELSLLNADSHR